MNIKCPECGNENQLGAIFCRTCGAKLDLETIRPVVKDKQEGGGVAGLVNRLLTVLALIVVLGIIAALFLPFGLKPYRPIAEEVATAATTKLGAVMLKVDTGKGAAQHVFTPDELTALVNSTLQKESKDASGYVLEDVMIDVTSAGELVVGVDTKLYGKVPARFELIGKPSVTEKEGAASDIGFVVTGASMGHIDMPVGILKEKIAEKFKILVQGQDVDRIIKALKNVEIDSEGNVVLTFVENAKASAKK